MTDRKNDIRMSTIFQWVLQVSIVLLIWTDTGFSGPQPELVKLATYQWPPYQTIENGKPGGIAVQRVVCILKAMNQKYQMFVVPSKRARILVEQGQYDAFFTAAIDEKYAQFAVRSKPIAEQKWNWYTLKETLVDPTYFFFKENAFVSALAGSDMRKWLENNDYKLKTSPSQPEALFKLLEIQRVDAVLSSEEVAKNIIIRLNLTGKINVTLVRNKPLGVYFSKQFIDQYPQFLDQFNARIDVCR